MITPTQSRKTRIMTMVVLTSFLEGDTTTASGNASNAEEYQTSATSTQSTIFSSLLTNTKRLSCPLLDGVGRVYTADLWL